MAIKGWLPHQNGRKRGRDEEGGGGGFNDFNNYTTALRWRSILKNALKWIPRKVINRNVILLT